MGKLTVWVTSDTSGIDASLGQQTQQAAARLIRATGTPSVGSTAESGIRIFGYEGNFNGAR